MANPLQKAVAEIRKTSYRDALRPPTDEEHQERRTRALDALDDQGAWQRLEEEQTRMCQGDCCLHVLERVEGGICVGCCRCSNQGILVGPRYGLSREDFRQLKNTCGRPKWPEYLRNGGW